MIRVLIVVLRVLAILFVVRLVLRAFASLARRSAPAPGAPREPGVALVRDRICNTFLPRERALRALVGGREEHFCSEACRERALAEAARAS